MQPHKIVTALFREIEFNCRHCPEKFTNSGFQNHQWDCVGQTFGCLLELCDRSNLTLQGLLDHWEQECSQVQLTCTDCNFSARRDKIPGHNCVNHLKQELAAKKE